MSVDKEVIRIDLTEVHRVTFRGTGAGDTSSGCDMGWPLLVVQDHKDLDTQGSTGVEGRSRYRVAREMAGLDT